MYAGIISTHICRTISKQEASIMKPLLNTLYVTSPEAYLSKDGLNIVVSINGQEQFRVPSPNIESIVTFGYSGASPGLMKLCVDSNISLTFLSPQGRFICRIQGPTKGNVLLRKQQYISADNPDTSLALAKIMIGAKIQNYRSNFAVLSEIMEITAKWKIAYLLLRLQNERFS